MVSEQMATQNLRGNKQRNKECIRDKDFRDILSLQACIIDDAEYLDEKI